MLKRRAMIKRWLVKQLMVALVLLAIVLVAELGLRVVGYSVPSLYTTDSERGIALRPGAEGWWRKEGEAYIKISSDGLRDREHVKPKPPGTLRIAVLGDSWAEAFQVPLEKTFWAVMERRLAECESVAGRKIEVINFGVSGFGTAQELLTLRRHVWEYSPDIVLLAFNGANDVSDNSRALRKEEDVPYFVYQHNELALDSSFLNSSTYQWRNSTLNLQLKRVRDYSRILQFVYDLPNAITANQAAKRRDVGATSDPGVNPAFYRPPADPVWADAWMLTETLLTMMNDEVLKGGAKFFVVTLDSAIEVHPDARVRQKALAQLGMTDFSYPNQRIEALGRRVGFGVFNLSTPLQSYVDEHKVFLHGFGQTLGGGHWNAEGHRVAGEMITEKLCQSLK